MEEIPQDTPSKVIPRKEEKNFLSEAFWATIADQPRCRRDGICDGCGRCEH